MCLPENDSIDLLREYYCRIKKTEYLFKTSLVVFDREWSTLRREVALRMTAEPQRPIGNRRHRVNVLLDNIADIMEEHEYNHPQLPIQSKKLNTACINYIGDLVEHLYLVKRAYQIQGGFDDNSVQKKVAIFDRKLLLRSSTISDQQTFLHNIGRSISNIRNLAEECENRQLRLARISLI